MDVGCVAIDVAEAEVAVIVAMVVIDIIYG